MCCLSEYEEGRGMLRGMGEVVKGEGGRDVSVEVRRRWVGE